MNIPMLDLSTEIAQLEPALLEAIRGVLRSGCFILGKQGMELEAKMGEILATPYVTGLNSGTDALIIGLRALDIGPGDEVITSSFSFFATAEAISLVGATPVFVDIDPQTFNMDPRLVEAAITPRTKAILPVHLFGHPAEMTPILRIAKERGLKVMEDTAQAVGAKYHGKVVGSLGDVGSFSFYPTKNLSTYGDGGLVVTTSEATHEKVRMLRNHGCQARYHHEMLGYNSRLDEIHAAILLVKLPLLASNNQKRRDAARRYHELLAGVSGVVLPLEAPGVESVYHQYTIRVQGGRRERVKAALAHRAIASMIYYPIPIHQSIPYRDRGFSLPHTELAAKEVLSLPMWPDITPTQQIEIVNTVKHGLDLSLS